MKAMFKRIHTATIASVSAAVALPATNASAQQRVGDLAGDLTGQMGNVGRLITAGAFVGGLVMLATGLMKLKQAADTQGNQVKYSEGMWRVGVGAALVAIPAFSGMLGATFGWTDSATITTGGGASF